MQFYFSVADVLQIVRSYMAIKECRWVQWSFM